MPLVAQQYTGSQHPKPEMPRILLVQDTVMCYLKLFFTRMSEIYDIKFIFKQQVWGAPIFGGQAKFIINRYGIETSGETNGVEGMKYKMLKSYGNIRYFGNAFELLNDLGSSSSRMLASSSKKRIVRRKRN